MIIIFIIFTTSLSALSLSLPLLLPPSLSPSYSCNCERLFLSDDEHSQFLLSHLLSPSPKLARLKDSIFIEVAKMLRPVSVLSPNLLKLTSLLASALEEELTRPLDQLKEGGATVTMTMQPVSMQFLINNWVIYSVASKFYVTP